MHFRRPRRATCAVLIGAIALSGLAGELVGASSAASARAPQSVAGGIVNANGAIIAGFGFTVLEV